MAQQSYEEYIRSVLGYPAMNVKSAYDFNNYNVDYRNSSIQNAELEECYPEIYKVVYPMVVKACNNNSRPLSREIVENMTDEIYMAIEGNESVQININLANDVHSNRSNVEEDSFKNSSEVENRGIPNSKGNRVNVNSGDNMKSGANKDGRDSRNIRSNANNIDDILDRENREVRQVNRNLRDIIKILILRELLGRPGFPGNRPPIRPRPPMRPPFPGMPGRPPMPRGVMENNFGITMEKPLPYVNELYENYSDIYEEI